MRKFVIAIVAILVTLAFTACSPTADQRGSYTSGTHAFYYTVTVSDKEQKGATLTQLDLIDGSGQKAVIVASAATALTPPYTSPTYTATLSGSTMPIYIEGIATAGSGSDAKDMLTITVTAYEDGSVLLSDPFSEASPASFHADFIL
jgi:ABC-type Fe3+-hydroxamate transport system substrate-binding protein